MSNRTNVILGGLVLAAIGLDVFFLHSGATLFLLKKLTDLVEYLAFWR